jgi:hypothetical protein
MVGWNWQQASCNLPNMAAIRSELQSVPSSETWPMDAGNVRQYTHTRTRTQRRQRQKANGLSRFSRSLAFSPDFSWVSVERKGGHTEKVAMSSPGAGRDKRQQHRPPSAPVGETPHGLIGNRVEEGTARLAQSLLERTRGQRIACTPALCSESSGRTKVAPKQPRSVLQ